MSYESSIQPKIQEKNQEPKEEGLETGKRVFEFLERTNFLRVRNSDEQFNEWIQNLSFDEYQNYLTRLNGILREVPIKNRSIDGSDVIVSFGITKDVSYLPPYSEQKDAMMREVFETLKKITDNEDRALLIYYAIQAIHPYSDGNGRTGRLLYKIFSEGGKGLTEEKLSELLDHEKKGNLGTGKGRDVFAEKVMDANSAYYYINREVAKEVLGNTFLEESGSIYVDYPSGVGYLTQDVEKKLSSDEASLVKRIIGEGDVKNFSFRGIVMSKFLSERPELQKFQFEVKVPLDERRGVVPEDFGKKISGVDAGKFLQILTKSDARRLIEIHRELKTKFIQTMIDIFANPENHKIKTKEGNEIDIKSVFRF